MTIFVVGSDKIFAIENSYVKHLRQAGMEVFHFPAQSFFYDYYQKGVLNKVLFKTGFSNIYQRINQQFRDSVQKLRPDVIWVFKGMEIFPASLEFAKNLGIKLVNFNPDNPFVFSGAGSGNANVTEAISLYDLHFTYNLAVKEHLEKMLDKKTVWLPFGFDISDEVFGKTLQQTEICEACFLGNPDSERTAFIHALADHDIKISVYGHDWDKFLSHPNIQINSPVYGDEQWKVLRRYRIQLNLMRPHNEGSHNMRTFEVPGVGGIMIAPDTQEHRMFFQSKVEAFFFETVADCAGQILKILQLSVEEANKIREGARYRSLTSAYTYKDRAEQALVHMQQLIGA